MPRYCFFGSSVTEQSKLYKTGETVGYVDYLILKHLDRDKDQFFRLAKGGTNINDAGIIYLNDILDWKPDFCFLDWCTAGDPRTDSFSVFYLYQTLLTNNITPITLIFPRKDRNVKNTQIYREQLSICRYYNLPFVEICPDVALRDLLRDDVHTNKFGAEVYADLINKSLNNMAISKCCVSPVKLEKYYHNCQPDIIYSQEVLFDFSKETCTEFDVIINKGLLGSEKKALIQIFMEQTIGLFSPVLIVQLENINKDILNRISINLFDKWCHYERLALKAVTPELSLDSLTCSIKGSISNELPDYSIIKDSIKPEDKRYLKKITRIFYILKSTQPLKVTHSSITLKKLN